MPNGKIFHVKVFFLSQKNKLYWNFFYIDQKKACGFLLWKIRTSPTKHDFLQAHESEINYCVKECLFCFHKRLCNTLLWETSVVIFPWTLRYVLDQSKHFFFFFEHSICLQEHLCVWRHTDGFRYFCYHLFFYGFICQLCNLKQIRTP